jgi:hypothetical protein
MADAEVAARRGGLVGSQALGPFEDPVPNGDVADVVQQPRQPEALDPRVVEAEGEGNPRAELGDNLAVIARTGGLGVDGAGERGREESLLMSRRALRRRLGRLRRSESE